MVKVSKEEDELAAIRARLQLERAQLSSEISSRLGSLSPSKPKSNGTTSNPFTMGRSSNKVAASSSMSPFTQRPATLGLGAELSDLDKRQTMNGAENARLRGVLVGKRKREVEVDGAAASANDGEDEEDSRASVVQKGKSKQSHSISGKKGKTKTDPFAGKKMAKGKKNAAEVKQPISTSVPTEEEMQGMSKKARKKLRKRLREESQGDTPIAQTSQPDQMKKEIKNGDPQPESNGQATIDDLSNMTPHQKSLKSQLSGARFRQINETLYTSSSSSALSYIQGEPSKLQEYHDGFREQVKGWPKVPVKQIAKMLQKGQEDAATSLIARKKGGRYAPSPLVVDLGAGEAILAKLLQEDGSSSIRVISYDLLDSDDGWVRGMDIAKGLPFPGSHVDKESKSQVVDVAIFCLSLMGTNWVEMIMEAHRILRQNGELIIAEVTSRFNTKDDFVKLIANLGFALQHEDASNTHFVLFEFVKTPNNAIFAKLQDDAERVALIEKGASILKPCIYKRSYRLPVMLDVKRKSFVIADQEVDFPRGGGTTLTPFEHQQVLREVKAEANAVKKARSSHHEKRSLEKQRANRERKNAIKKKSISNGGTVTEEAKKERKAVRIERLNLKRLNPETRLLCCIQAVHPLYLLLSLPDRLYGRVPITNISSILTSRLESFADDDNDGDSSSASSSSGSEDEEGKDKMPELNNLYKKGQWVIASVVTKKDPKDLKGKARGINKDSLNVELTLDPKIVNEGVTSADLSPGYLLPMTVKSKEDNGYLMDVGFGNLNGFISFKEAARSLAVGQVVNASVLSVSESRRSILASLRESKVVNSKIEVAPSLSALLPGSLVRGLITAKSDRGVVVKLFGLFDASITSYQLSNSECKVGQHVVARVLWTSLDSYMEERKIALSAKSFVVKFAASEVKTETNDKEATLVEKTETNGVKDAGQVEKSKVSGKRTEVQEVASSEESDDGVEDDEEEDEEDDEHELMTNKDKMVSSKSEDSEEESGRGASKRTALELPGGLSWTAGAAATEDSSSSDNDEVAEVTKPTKKRKGKVDYQEDLTATLATKTPDTIQDFERLLLGSPNSSFLWIQYMSFQLQLGDVAKGRETGRRALQVINFREEQEKFNIWIALLNLENTFGSEESLEEVYKEACAYNDDKKISLRFVEILEKSGKDAEEHWKKVIKKFGQSSKIWVEYHRFLLRRGKEEEARAMIPRSMQSLEKRKHVKTIVACALNDFKMGGLERGRTIFEGLIDTYPKRLDLWWQYIDQESRIKNTAGVRDLFERLLSLKQSSKKVKSVLKKWLEYEKTHGDAQGEQNVLNRARRFVEERSAAKEESNDEE